MIKLMPISILNRFLIFCFWVFVIALFLLFPKAVNYLRPERSLTIFTWPLMLDPIYLKQFEKETGIKLYITYYDSSAALLSKLDANNGFGYDLIIADDHTAELIIQKNLVRPFDSSQLLFKESINPFLLSHYYDPQNKFTIPHYWGFYGMGFDSEYFKNQYLPHTWGLLFNPELMPAKICMTDDPRESLMIAAQYLFGTIDALKDPEKVAQIKKLLLDQKKRVEIYSIARADNLLQLKSCPVASIMSPEIQRLQKEHEMIKFLAPQEGSFLVIDLFMMLKSSKKDALIYQFLNYVYQPEVITHHTDLFGYCSPLHTTLSSGPCEQQPTQFDFFRNILTDSEINNIWIEILAS